MDYRLPARLLLAVLTLSLAACVTTEGRVFTAEASPEEAVKTRTELARSYIREQNWEDAKRNLKIAQDIEPNSPEVHEAFALVYQSTGEYELAEKSFKRALALRKPFSRARNNYAAFLFQQGRFEEAEVQLEIVVQDTLYESRARAFTNLGLCRQRLENPEGAREAFRRALAMDRTNTLVLLELAQIEFGDGNWVRAEQYLGTYRAVVRQQSARALWLGIRLADKLDNDDAKASYALALRNLYPRSVEFQAYERAVQSGSI